MVVRALGGSRARKLRAVLPDFGLKGEKAVATEVRYLVSILLAASRVYGAGGCKCFGRRLSEVWLWLCGGEKLGWPNWEGCDSLAAVHMLETLA